MSISEELAGVLKALNGLIREYQFYSEKLAEIEKKKLDLLHYIELDGTTYRDRNKLATQLRNCLLERRRCKDEVELRAPVAEFLALPQNKNLLDKLGRVLGDTRKVEKHHHNRSYHPRILPRPTTDTVGKTETNENQISTQEGNN